jgi:Domain of unknown function (DUF4157)
MERPVAHCAKAADYAKQLMPLACLQRSKLPLKTRAQPKLAHAAIAHSATPTTTLHPIVQAKLRIGTPDHHYEREADRMAEKVMLEQGLASEPAEPILQPKRATYEGEADEEKPLQTKAESSFPSARSSPGCSSVPSSMHAALNPPGQPLAAETRAFFEPRFGHDFSVVRVHADSCAAASARAFNALAYTTGQHVVFAEGNFSPRTTKGKRLLAHELAHVVQQTSQASTPHLQRAPDDEPKPRRDVAIVGEGWEGAEELGKVLAGGGEVHNVTSLDQAVEVLKAINYPVGTLYFITHSTARGDLQFGINEKMVDVDRIGGKFKGLIPADNAPQTVDFRGCSVGSDPKAMEKIRKAFGAQSVIGGTCFAVIAYTTPIEIPEGTPVTKSADLERENDSEEALRHRRELFEGLFKRTARKLGDAEPCIVSRREDDFFAAGGRFVALFFNPEFKEEWVPGESVCYNEVSPQVVDVKAPATAVDTCELIVVEKPAATEPAPEEVPSAPESQETPATNE